MELEIIKKLIKTHSVGHACTIEKTMTAERYYKNENDILFKKKESGSMESPLRNADNRIPNNFHGLLVNQKASYIFADPPLFDVDKEESNRRIVEVLGDNFEKVCKDLCINAANAGKAWVHYWLTSEGEFEYSVVDSKQIIPIWSSQLNKQLLGLFRVYPQHDEMGDLYDVYEFWNDTECFAYRKRAGDTIDEGLENYSMFTSFIVDTGTLEQSDVLTHGFGAVPFIPFPNNNLYRNDLSDIKRHVDAYDRVYSGFVNDLEDIQEVIFILTNYEGEDLGSFLSELKKYKTIKTNNGGDSDKSGLSTLSIDIPIEARKELLEITRREIFEKGQGVDPQPEKFGNASGVALKFMYSLLELKAGLLETEFRLGFGELIRAICRYLNVECKTITQTWTRTAITNDIETAGICTSSMGVISKRTIIANHPFVENFQMEIDEIQVERQADVDNYAGAFKEPVSEDEA